MREQRVGQFSRSLQLPATYTADPSEATYEQGILRLVFPKSEQAEPRRIQLNRRLPSGLAMASSSASSRLICYTIWSTC